MILMTRYKVMKQTSKNQKIKYEPSIIRFSNKQEVINPKKIRIKLNWKEYQIQEQKMNKYWETL